MSVALIGCGRIGFDAEGSASSGLVGCWSFDEGRGTTASDCSGNGNHGTLSGATTWTAGRMNNAVSFAGGVADTVTVPSASILTFDTGSFSFGLWVRLDVGLTTGFGCPIWKGGSSTFYAGYCFVFGASTQTWDASLSDGVTQLGLHSPPFEYRDGMWHHLFAVIDRTTSTESLYIDGARVAGTSISTLGSLASANDLEFDGDEDPILGALDEVRIYDRALSDSEVEELFASPGSR